MPFAFVRGFTLFAPAPGLVLFGLFLVFLERDLDRLVFFVFLFERDCRFDASWSNRPRP